MAGRIATSADGVPIYYDVHGRGPVALVFVHGWCCNRGYWSEQVAHFARDHTVVAIDLAGHGESGRGRAAWTMRAFGQDVSAVVRTLDLSRAVLVGHSMGGPVIAEAAALMPGTVVGLVGVDTWKSLGVTRTPEQADEGLADIRADFLPAAQERVRRMFIASSPPEMVGRVIASMTSAPPRIAVGALEALYSNDARLQATLKALSIPKAAIDSDYQPVDVEAARRHGIAVMLMSGAGHFVMMEDPATFNRLLRETVNGWLHG